MFSYLFFFLIGTVILPPIEMSDVDVSYDDFKSLTTKDTDLIIDVRNPDELKATGTIPNSINIPLPELEEVLKTSNPSEFKEKYGKDKPETETPIVFICRSGRRSLDAVNIAKRLGYKNYFPATFKSKSSNQKEKVGIPQIEEICIKKAKIQLPFSSYHWVRHFPGGWLEWEQKQKENTGNH